MGSVKIFGKVYLPQGQAYLRQVKFFPYFLRQSLLHQIRAGGKSLLHRAGDQLLTDPRRQGIYRHYAQKFPGLGSGSILGIYHLPPDKVTGHLAVENVAFIKLKITRGVFLVEKNYIHHTGIVGNAKLCAGAAAGYAHGLGSGYYLPGNADILIGQQGADVSDRGTVKIASGIIAQNVLHRGNAQPAKGLGPFFADALEIFDIRTEGQQGYLLLLL